MQWTRNVLLWWTCHVAKHWRKILMFWLHIFLKHWNCSTGIEVWFCNAIHFWDACLVDNDGLLWAKASIALNFFVNKSSILEKTTEMCSKKVVNSMCWKTYLIVILFIKIIYFFYFFLHTIFHLYYLSIKKT